MSRVQTNQRTNKRILLAKNQTIQKKKATKATVNSIDFRILSLVTVAFLNQIFSPFWSTLDWLRVERKIFPLWEWVTDQGPKGTEAGRCTSGCKQLHCIFSFLRSPSPVSHILSCLTVSRLALHSSTFFVILRNLQPLQIIFLIKSFA